MELVYNLLIQFYYFILKIAALFHPKAQLFVSGRKNWIGQLQQLKTEKLGDKKVIWMHCASLGEFEQGKPILEQLKNQYPEYAYVLTFYSPSGYEYRKKYAGADAILYLPVDTPSNAKHFVQILQPEIALFVKYEFWHNYIQQLHLAHIPIIYFSVIFQKRHIYFKWHGGFFRKMLQRVDHFFIQNEHSALLLEQIGIKNYTIAGDTRFDSAIANTQEVYQPHQILSFIGDKKIIIAGSTWDNDDLLLAHALNLLPENFALIIAPHDIHDARIQQTERFFKTFDTIKFSEILAEQNLANKKVLIIDNIGVLKFIYRYADFVWIGGGLNKGIHNTVEAAVYGKALAFGPNYKKFQEAIDLIEQQAAMTLNANEASQLADLIQKGNALATMGSNALQYSSKQRGATQIIVDYVVVKYLSIKA